MKPMQAAANHSPMDGALLEKIILQGDVSGLTSLEKVKYITGLCYSLGLNPHTQPIRLIKFDGKEVPYTVKDGTDQLRQKHKVSINKIETQMHAESGIYVVSAYVQTGDGRQDVSTGAVVISGLKGAALANAMMKAETKAKRRATLSICGLGILDESELDTIPHAREVDITPKPVEIKKIVQQKEVIDEQPSDETEMQFHAYLIDIENCQTIDELKVLYTSILKSDIKKYPKYITKLIEAKDKCKSNIERNEKANDVDLETGEILS